MLKYEEVMESYGTIGRWFAREIDGIKHLVTINMGSQLYFKAQGTREIALQFKVVSTPCAIVYQINGDKPKRCILSDEPIKIATQLDIESTYIIKITVDDIPEQNNLWELKEGVIFKEAIVDEGGEIKGIRPTCKKLLFIGDSITAGLCVRQDEKGQPYTGGASINYAAICSQRLEAVDIRCAFGYTGIINKGPLGIPCCSGYLDNICIDIKDTSDTLAGIMINHGTNDALNQRSKEEFKVGYKEVLDRLRDKYPEVIIYTIIPFGQYMADEIRTVVKDQEKVVLIETEDWEVTYVPDGIHVDEEGSRQAGERLSKFISKMI